MSIISHCLKINCYFLNQKIICFRNKMQKNIISIKQQAAVRTAGQASQNAPKIRDSSMSKDPPKNTKGRVTKLIKHHFKEKATCDTKKFIFIRCIIHNENNSCKTSHSPYYNMKTHIAKTKGNLLVLTGYNAESNKP